MAIPEGWETILKNDQQKETDEQRQKRQQLNKDFVLTFSSEHGQRVLEYFKGHTLNQPTWMPGSPEGQAEWREGQNTIVREIEYRSNIKNEEV